MLISCGSSGSASRGARAGHKGAGNPERESRPGVGLLLVDAKPDR